MQIRIATRQDADDVRGIHLSAFPEGESEVVSKLAVSLLSEETAPPTVSLLAEVDGVAVGHVAFSSVAIDSIKDFQGYILAPLAVRPDFQKRCIGSRLVESDLWKPHLRVIRERVAHALHILDRFHFTAHLNKVRVITRHAYGYHTFRALEVALYHNLARLPKPPRTHKFC